MPTFRTLRYASRYVVASGLKSWVWAGDKRLATAQGTKLNHINGLDLIWPLCVTITGSRRSLRNCAASQSFATCQHSCELRTDNIAPPERRATIVFRLHHAAFQHLERFF